MNKIIAFGMAILFLLPAAGFINNGNKGKQLIWYGEKSIYIKAGDDFYIHFNSSHGLEFKEQQFNLTSLEKKAIARAPPWIRSRLARQFEFINESYARLILNSPRKYVDEIAFSIATCPVNAMPPPKLLYDNARFIYQNAKHIQYARLIELDNGSTTIEYTMLDNGKEKHIVCPMSIYYWYVVHPRITFEDAEYVYGEFWREYLFYHNDIDYPLLMEKLDGIEWLWDNKTYYPPAHRTWKWSMENHPTAIEALSYWIGKTVNQLATGDRPGQPNVIAHEHNGYCGELQQIAVAAQRAALIPSVGICDLGEDHVWREFWAGGWHECDNWWADGGGCVANYSEYRYRWGKIISALFAWRGDSSIYDVTPKYIRKEDRGIVEVSVVDAMGKPVDGARVVVFGSWKANNFKDKMWGKTIGRIWQLMPEKFRERWQEKYSRIWKFYKERVPGLIPWIWPSIWNYTDMDGKCKFNLGLGHSYLFLVNKDDILYYGPFSIGKSNALHYYVTMFPNETRHMHIHFILPDMHERAREPNLESKKGKHEFSLAFNTKAYQLQRNPWDWKKGMNPVSSKIKLFVVDEENFRKYKAGMPFNAMVYSCAKNGSIEFNATDCYIVFKNDAKRSDIVLNFRLKIEGEGDFIHIKMPDFGIVDKGMVEIKGISTGEGIIRIDGKTWNVEGNFTIEWNASIGKHIIYARCSDFEKEYEIYCYDISPPEIEISPHEEAGKILHLKGVIEDNDGIKEAKAFVGGMEISLQNKFDLNISLQPGDYVIKIIAIDASNNSANKSISFTILGNDEKPAIGKVYYSPLNPSNESDIFVYAFVNKTFYNISNVSIIINGRERKMFEYASHPMQPRHDEDELKNKSNTPRYGIELAQMEKGTYKFRIKAVDTAGNVAMSKEYEMVVN